MKPAYLCVECDRRLTFAEAIEHGDESDHTIRGPA